MEQQVFQKHSFIYYISLWQTLLTLLPFKKNTYGVWHGVVVAVDAPYRGCRPGHG